MIQNWIEPLLIFLSQSFFLHIPLSSQLQLFYLLLLVHIHNLNSSARSQKVFAFWLTLWFWLSLDSLRCNISLLLLLLLLFFLSFILVVSISLVVSFLLTQFLRWRGSMSLSTSLLFNFISKLIFLRVPLIVTSLQVLSYWSVLN